MTDRRLVLQAAAVSAVGLVLLPGCSKQTEPPAAPPTPDPQQADEAALIALYDAALSTATATERELWQRIRDEHAAHLAALGWQGDLAAATPASATPAALRQAERRATRVRAQAARSEPDAQRAQVLALIAASEAQHAVALS